VKHPSLSLNGFSCGEKGANCNFGLGLEQILGKRYATEDIKKINVVFDALFNHAAEKYEEDPTGRKPTKQNTQRLQALGFAALTTYILEQNGLDLPREDLSLPTEVNTHQKAMDAFRAHLTRPGSWFPYWLNVDGSLSIFEENPADLTDSFKADKWASPLMNVARAMDFYLAIENAYCYYGANGHTPSQSECSGATHGDLLSQSEKDEVFSGFGLMIHAIDALGVEDLAEWVNDNVTEVVPEELNAYDAFPGNWPLKAQSAIGYASLTTAMTNLPSPFSDPPFLYNDETFEDYVQRAFRANYGSQEERHRYWSYQTGGGRRFWAEGPYYMHYALNTAVSFWHATRVNDLLDYHPAFNAPDPFHTDRFTDPLTWLADVATPDRRIPPLDDGNRASYNYETILRWNSNYGNGEVGRKFAWINSNDDGNASFGSNDDLLPVELAVPRDNVTAQSPPRTLDENANDGSGQEQQLIARDGNNDSQRPEHYVLLNGETSEAIDRGEGHEHPDNMQLLYYVDNASYLMDSGFGSAGVLGSEWNNYWDHNVIFANERAGLEQNWNDTDWRGLRSFRYPLEPGGQSDPPRAVSDHRPIGNFSLSGEQSKVTTIHAEQELEFEGKSLSIIGIEWVDGTACEDNFTSDYYRDVLLVEKGNGQDPYVIDLNRNEVEANINDCLTDNNKLPPGYFNLGYHINQAGKSIRDFNGTHGRPFPFVFHAQQ
jgi:hypothetical protein